MTAIIWKISLYTKVEKKEEAECNVCKANGEKKFTISTINCGTAGLITHLKSKHRETEYYKKYEALEKTKQKLEPKGSIDKYVNILSGGHLIFGSMSLFLFIFQEVCLHWIKRLSIGSAAL